MKNGISIMRSCKQMCYYQAAELNQKTNLKDCRACMNTRDQKNCTYKLMSFKNCSEELGQLVLTTFSSWRGSPNKYLQYIFHQVHLHDINCYNYWRNATVPSYNCIIQYIGLKVAKEPLVLTITSLYELIHILPAAKIVFLELECGQAKK